MSESSHGFKALIAYQKAFMQACEIFEITISFPKEEKYSLTDQIRRSSRSVCANLAEAIVKEIIISIIYSKYLTVRVRIVKLWFGLISHSIATI